MAQSRFDPDAFKAQQRDQWSNAAQGWRKWWPHFERDAQPLSDRMMELAQVGPGKRVLDVATGIGEPAMTAAKRVGPTGSVVAIDQAPQMLTLARERAREAGMENIEFLETDAERLNAPPQLFDAVVCRWGLMFFPDVGGTLGRLRSALKPGGHLVATVWGPPERVPLLALPMTVLTRELNLPSPAPGGPSLFALANPAILEQALRDASFTDVASETFPVTFEFASMDEMLGYLRDVAAPIRTVIAAQSPERQAELWGKIAEADKRFQQPDGSVRIPNECLIVSGIRRDGIRRDGIRRDSTWHDD